jgi:hypothetical protein
MWKALLAIGPNNQGMLAGIVPGRMNIRKAIQACPWLLEHLSYWRNDDQGKKGKFRSQERHVVLAVGMAACGEVSETWPSYIPLRSAGEADGEYKFRVQADGAIVRGYLAELYRLNSCLQLRNPCHLSLKHPEAMMAMAIAYTNVMIMKKGGIPPSSPEFKSEVPVSCPSWDVPGLRLIWAPIAEYEEDALDNFTPANLRAGIAPAEIPATVPRDNEDIVAQLL